MLNFGTLAFTSCEPGANLTLENQMSTEIIIVHEGLNKEGVPFNHSILTTVPAGQTIKTKLITLRRDSIGWTVFLKAENPSGKVVWQKSWPFEEFVKPLNEV